MAKLVECIPNFSCSKEKDEAAYNALVDVAKSVPGCTLFDAQTDGNHNRCVFTMIGSPEAIEEVAFQLAKKAAEVIDMTKHVGEHSRMGATDVIPFVPTMGVTVEECVEISKRLGQRIWDELKIPSFLYEDSASAPHRRNQVAFLQAEPVVPNHHGLIIGVGLEPAKPCDLNAGAPCQRLEVPVQCQAADRAAAHQKNAGGSSLLEVFVQFYVIVPR